MRAPARHDNGREAVSTEPLALERIVFFSDAVIAIAITLLAINLRVPDIPNATDADFLQALAGLAPQYLTFVITFAVVALYWRAHHRMFRFIVAWDSGLLGVNLLFLFFVVQLPLLSSILGSYGNLSSATALYAIGLSLMGIASVLVWVYAARRHLLSPDLDAAAVRSTGVRSALIPAVFLISAGVAFISPGLAQLSWLLATVISLAYRRPY